jgi:hypothetical protein
MFWLIRFTFKTVVMLKLMALAFSAGMGAAYLIQLRAQYHSWGLLKGGAERGVSGDALVPEADLVETRVLDIEATPDQVWPWLAQLGYGRGGWYSYSALDRPWSPGGGEVGSSADVIVDEYQDIAEGDLVPTHPGGGFEARIVEPGEALVLFLDDGMMRDQVEQAVADRTGDEEAASRVSMEMPPYAVSWAFELEEAAGGRTHLIERLRLHIDDLSDSQRRAAPALSMGVFAMMRSQMLGIKQRVEEATDAAAAGAEA